MTRLDVFIEKKEYNFVRETRLPRELLTTFIPDIFLEGRWQRKNKFSIARNVEMSSAAGWDSARPVRPGTLLWRRRSQRPEQTRRFPCLTDPVPQV